MVDRVIVLLGESADLLEGVHTTLVAAVAGTSRSRYEQVVATFAEARRDNAELLDECARLRAGIDVVLARVVAVVGDGALPPAAEDRVRAVRRELRPGVRGARAAGWWLHPDGSRTRVLSGRDSDPNSWQQQAERFLRREFPDDWPELSVLARHVEVKIAFRLLDRPPGDEVVVMDRKVCGRDPITAGYPYTCDKLLPFLLQEGTTLTVVEDDGTRVTYRGRRPR